VVTVDLIKTKRIGPKLSEKLIKAGIKDVNQLAASKPENIAKARMRVPKF
jgi:predicted flap endonuclease-1-like 5' DNA nuclease